MKTSDEHKSSVNYSRHCKKKKNLKIESREKARRKGNEMSALFARVVKQALLTFERENYPAFKSNFMSLKQLVDQLTSVDLNIDFDAIKKSFHQTHTNMSTAPVIYMEILDHQTFSMSVFILMQKYTMPLHDHPGYGLLKVVNGQARINSYSLDVAHERTTIMPVTEEEPLDVTSHSECSVLTPTQRNLHEIMATGDDAVAFFDILGPPYDSKISIYGPKKCAFYRKMSMMSTASNANDRRVYLQHIKPPTHYYCDSIRYNRPDFMNEPSFLYTTNQ